MPCAGISNCPDPAAPPKGYLQWYMLRKEERNLHLHRNTLAKMRSRPPSFISLRKSQRTASPAPPEPPTDFEQFASMSYERAQREDADAPSPVLSTASLPRQGRAKVDPPPPPSDPEAAKALQHVEEDSEENYKPKTIKFWMVMLGLYCALFVVALVSRQLRLWNKLCRVVTIKLTSRTFVSIDRTVPSYQLPFQKLRTHSTP